MTAWLQSQVCNKRFFGQIQESSKGFVFQMASWLAGWQSQDCNIKDIWPDSGIQQRIRFPDSGLQQIIYFSGIRIATEIFIPPEDCSIFSIPPELGLQRKYLFIQSQKELWQYYRIQQRARFPDSGLQLIIHSSRVRIATKREFCKIQESSKGSVFGFGVATDHLFPQRQDCNENIYSSRDRKGDRKSVV